MFTNQESFDFLILCESKIREEPSLIMLVEELRRRGYTADYLFGDQWFNSRKKNKKNCKVLIINAAFSDEHIEFTFFSSFGVVEKVVSLRWEQIESKYFELKKHGYEEAFLSDLGKTIHYCCWGNNFYQRMLKCGVPAGYLHITGPMHMDFCRSSFAPLFLSKDELKMKYGIPKDKKMLLFLASDSLRFLSKSFFQQDENYQIQFEGREFEEYVEFENKIVSTLTQWFKAFLSELDNEWVIVYRDHPGVLEDKILVDMAKETENFFYISELPAIVWLLASDKIATVTSTMIAEAYYAQKPCLILRPYPVPEQLDIMLYDGVPFVSTYDEFNKKLKENSPDQVVIPRIKEYYDVQKTPSYLRCADVLEEIYHNSDGKMAWNEQNVAKIEILKKKRIEKDLRQAPYRIISNAVKRVLLWTKKWYTPKTKFLKQRIEKIQIVSTKRTEKDTALQKRVKDFLRVNGDDA